MDENNPYRRPRVLDNWEAALAGDEPLELEARIRRADGKYRWFLDRTVPLRDGKGNVVKWYTTLTDIEDRKQAEEKLRASEAYLAEAQRLSRTGSSAWDPAGRQIVHWSEETYRIFSFDPKQGVPSFQRVLQRADPEDRERVIEDFELDCGIVLPDAAIKYLHAVGYPVFNAPGDLVEFVSTMMDVTERKRGEEELSASEQVTRKQVEALAQSLDFWQPRPRPISLLAKCWAPFAGSLMDRV